MPKFRIKSYEEVFYEGEIEAEDEDEAEAEFALSLGEISPFSTKQQYTTLEVKEIQNA
jgi:hypothetical protein